MQTFLPYPDIQLSVKSLDDKRLGKQRVEAAQIFTAIEYGGAWANHPAVRMWEGFGDLLAYYHNTCIAEWVARGKVNNMPLLEEYWDIAFPWWWGNRYFHWSHQSNLVRKDPEFYANFLDIADNWLYLWPDPDEEKGFRVVIPKWAKEKKYFNPLNEMK